MKSSAKSLSSSAICFLKSAIFFSEGIGDSVFFQVAEDGISEDAGEKRYWFCWTFY